MPVCNGCGASYEDTYQFCPYCGRAKPEPQKLEIDVRVVEHNTGTVCPTCQRSDQIKKVSGIIASQTEQTAVTQAQKGQKTTVIYSVASDLVKKLSASPARPKVPPSRLLWIVIVGLFIISTISTLTSGSDEGSGVIVVFCLIPLLVILAILVYQETQRKGKLKAYQNDQERWQAMMQLKEKMFYCYRCDNVFIPGSSRTASPDSYLEFLREVTAERSVTQGTELLKSP